MTSINESQIKTIAHEKAHILHQLHYENVFKLYADLKKTAKDDIDNVLSNDAKLIPPVQYSQVQHTTEGTFSGSIKELVATHSWPCAIKTISSYYGYRTHPLFGTVKLHTGIDFPAPIGTDVFAWNKGKVLSYKNAEETGGYGNQMIIDHGGGVTTNYDHLSSPVASTGDFVESGALIAKSGSSGYSTGPHLHFEIRLYNVPVDPLPYLSGAKNHKVKHVEQKQTNIQTITIDDPYPPVNGKIIMIVLSGKYTVGGKKILVERDFGIKVIEFINFAIKNGKPYLQVKDGYRTYKTQKSYHDAYVNFIKTKKGINPGIAASPDVGNHRKGKAVDFFLTGDFTYGIPPEAKSDYQFIKDKGAQFGLYNNYGLDKKEIKTDLPHFSFDGN